MIRQLGMCALLVLAACSPKQEATKDKVPTVAPAPIVVEATGTQKEVTTPGATKDSATPFRNDAADVLVAAKGDTAGGDKLEYKIRMKAGDTVAYSWDAGDAANLWHEFHGHDDDVVSFYKKASGAKFQGTLTAPFDGEHGWYFENRSDKPVVVHVRTGGFYALTSSK